LVVVVCPSVCPVPDSKSRSLILDHDFLRLRGAAAVLSEWRFQLPETHHDRNIAAASTSVRLEKWYCPSPTITPTLAAR